MRTYPSVRNPVAKNGRTYNKSVVHTDRKRASRRGERKHKQNYTMEDLI